jgi:rubredoxin
MLIAQTRSKEECKQHPYSSPKGIHRHRCLHCNTVFEHRNNPENELGGPDKERDHKCPECGARYPAVDLFWYRGPLDPKYITPAANKIRILAAAVAYVETLREVLPVYPRRRHYDGP